MQTVIIVGAGHAAGQAAASLRQVGFEGDIVMLGAEDHAPYQRPPLSKAYLSGAEDRARLYLRTAKFYADKRIDVRTGVTVETIERARKQVITDAGDTLDYDTLLIATGGRPRRLQVPGHALDGIYYLRTIADADRIRAAMSGAKNICIIGGGYIGLEVAAIARGLHKNVTVLEMAERVLQRVTTPELSEFYHELHSSRGVAIRVQTAASGFVGDTRVTAVECGTEQLAAELVVIGIGIIPNVEVAQTAGLECADGIVVDEYCRTNDANIYAIGDCTNHPNPVLGRRLRLESVPNAIAQAKVAAANIVGGNLVHDEVPWFWSDQYEFKLQMVGFAMDGDQHVLRGTKENNRFAVFHLKDHRIVGVDAVNSPRDFMMGKKLFGAAIEPRSLADENTELRTLLD